MNNQDNQISQNNQNNESSNKLNNNIINSNNSNDKISNPINQTDLKIEKNGLNNEFNIKDNNKRPTLPLRTRSMHELPYDPNDFIRTKRLQLINKKNHSTSFDQEKIKLKIHNEEWYLKTQKIFDYSKFNMQLNDFKCMNDINPRIENLGELSKDSLNEQYWSSRLTRSHHSSSSEEWYKEINDKVKKLESESKLLIDNVNSGSSNLIDNIIDSNCIVNKMINLQEITHDSKVEEQNKLNELKNDLDYLAKEKEETNVDDNKETKLDIRNQDETIINDSVDKVPVKSNESDMNTKNEETSNAEKTEVIAIKECKNQISNGTISNDVNKIKVNQPVESENNKESIKLNAKIDNHLNLSNSKSTKEPNKKTDGKKSKIKLSKIGKKCILMYIFF